jgi:choline dehydrogenase
VIVCAGVVGSPQLVMLSGTAGQLRTLGISPVADTPAAGENLQDHPIALATQDREQRRCAPPQGCGLSSVASFAVMVVIANLGLVATG